MLTHCNFSLSKRWGCTNMISACWGSSATAFSLTQIAITPSKITQRQELLGFLVRCQHRCSTGSLSYPTRLASQTKNNAPQRDVDGASLLCNNKICSSFKPLAAVDMSLVPHDCTETVSLAQKESRSLSLCNSDEDAVQSSKDCTFIIPDHWILNRTHVRTI